MYRPDITLAVDWDVKHQFKQTKLVILNDDHPSRCTPLIDICFLLGLISGVFDFVDFTPIL